MQQNPIGVFDSGYGGLTILRKLTAQMPSHDFIYLGDNARAPYGTRSFETIYKYTLQAVKWFFEQGCPLVVLACNTASAKALRTIQQNDLPNIDPSKRVLGIVRPTSEVIGDFTETRKVGVMATKGTVLSESYKIEINKSFPDIEVFQEYCPMWVPLVENNEFASPGADYFIKKHIKDLLKKDAHIDTVLLACTHYPLLMQKIKEYMPVSINIVEQGNIVTESLVRYLSRHTDMNDRITKGAHRSFFTTDDPHNFSEQAAIFYGQRVQAGKVDMQ
ncbi:MAG: glutamate racemase [Pseudopedobacter saltans]|uniref:Glutamate racemase n=1 Tax=Pseudopedobacter saltans TaxID=151895 RepID=A0A2W5F8Q7_9SPHI|nr:MAG: glutamate racemase [Pseudopedobacter saltans]